ncbi:MAG: hypothetical protein AABZ53_15655 [Planctomycetota bacterium]
MAVQPSIPTPATPSYFDYPRAAREARLSEADVRALIRIFETDYPDDLMLRELHILRVCNSIIRGTSTIKQVLESTDSRAA